MKRMHNRAQLSISSFFWIANPVKIYHDVYNLSDNLGNVTKSQKITIKKSHLEM